MFQPAIVPPAAAAVPVHRLTRSQDAGSTTVPLIQDTIGHCFEAAARRFAQREALVVRHQGQRYTYAELDAESNRLASALLQLGLLPGDHAGIWAHNCHEWVLMQLATAKVGIVLVSMDPAWNIHEAEHVLDKTRCKLVVTLPAYRDTDYIAMLREANTPRLRWIVQLGPRSTPATLRFTDLLAKGDPQDQAVRAAGSILRATDPINVQFAGGSLATLTHQNVLNNGFCAGEQMWLTAQDRVCIPVPLHQGFGMVLGNLACLTHGAAIVYPSATFDSHATLETLQAEHCTALHGTPSQFIALLEHPYFGDFNLWSMRTGIMAGPNCPTEVVRQVVDRMHLRELTLAYCLTEASRVICQSSAGTPMDLRVATIGRVQPHLEIKVVEPATGAVVPVGTPGELRVRGYAVMRGYAPESAEAIDAEGWMRTGEAATMDGQGYVRILGRLEDTVVQEGEPVYPREIEEVLYLHPAVSEVRVLAQGDAHCACIVLKSGLKASEEDVRAFCRERVAGHKVPRLVRFCSALPVPARPPVDRPVPREPLRPQVATA
jgi:fatty-acyl-CoA synthase